MSKEIKIERDPDCSSFQCTSEIKLETDVLKIEVDIDGGCEVDVEPQQIKSEIEHVQRGTSSDWRVGMISLFFYDYPI